MILTFQNMQLTNYKLMISDLFNLSKSTTPVEIFLYSMKGILSKFYSYISRPLNGQAVKPDAPSGVVSLPESHFVSVTKIPAGQFIDFYPTLK